MTTKITVIGCGNLGTAVIKGLAGSGDYTLVACDKVKEKLDAVEDLVSETTTDASAAVRDADVVALAVKPDVAGAVLDRIDLSPSQYLVSFCAAVPVDFLESRTDAGVVRVMPNLAAEHGEMAAAVTPPGVVRDSEAVADVLSALGSYVEVDEEYMDIATAVNGSGPAFVFYLMKAMMESGVESGLSDEEAEQLVVQTFRGAAEIVDDAERSIDELIDAVCSPGGTTIEGMKVLRERSVKEGVAEAVDAAEERSVEISRKVSEELDT